MRSSGLPVPGTVHIRAAPAGAAIALSPAIAAMTPVIRVRDMITLYPRPRSSAGQSIRLLSGGSQVRVLAGALAAAGIAARLVRRGVAGRSHVIPALSAKVAGAGSRSQ